MMDYGPLWARLASQAALEPLLGLRARVEERLDEQRHGDLARWREALEALPPCLPGQVRLGEDAVGIRPEAPLGEAEVEAFTRALMAFHPWRKGPFDLYGIHMDTEWRSDLKWRRVLPHLAPLAGRRVLDVGCGSGYHCWRMAGEGAGLVLGIDPMLLFVMQYWAIRRYLDDPRVWVLPLPLEEMPAARVFDTVFSMGVLYHRRSPFDHLQRLRDLLRPGGELVLETLVVEGDERTLLMPEGRYAQMNNVWFLPSTAMLELWLRRAGYRRVRTVDVAVTTAEEQRSTPWMTFQSLPDYLDPDDPGRTLEGYPAPMRAIVLAEAP